MLGFSPLAAAPLADDVGVNQTVTTIVLTSGTSWTVPSDWNNSLNTIEVIGGSGSGASHRSPSIRYATGGGGGGYSRVSNQTLSGSVSYVIGTAGSAVARTTDGLTNGNAGTATWFGAATQVSSLVAANGGGGGIAAASGTAAGGAGGSLTGAIGTIRYTGGSGGAQTVSGGIMAFSSGGGGGGGPKGAGLNGVSNTVAANAGTNGGAGGNGFGGIAGTGRLDTTGGSNGGNGSDLSKSGSGGGGGGYKPPDGGGTYVAYSGGNYGGGGGGITSNAGTSITSGAGAGGLIVIRYVPLPATSLTASNITAGAPEVGTPTAGSRFGVVDITAGTPVVDETTLSQTHVLSTVDTIAGTVTIDTVTLGWRLTTVGITATPIVGASSIQQTHVLTSVGIEATPVVGSSTMVVTYNMVPTDIVAGATVVTTPNIAQTHKFTSTNIVNGRIVVPVPILRGNHVLASVGMQARLVFMPPGPRLRNLWATNAVNIVAGNVVLTAATAGIYTPSSRSIVSMELTDQPKPVQDWMTKVYIVGGSNQVVLQIDATTVEIYGGPNITDADSANSITGAYVGQTYAE